jgi:hypothetical protein
MTKRMAIVKISYTRSRGAAKASVRYIAHRPGKDGKATVRSIYGIDGEVTKTDAYNMIDEAKRGAAFFRIVISPDPEKEDTYNDLYLWQITENTILTLEERLKKEVPFIAVEHNDHAPHRHVHVLACVKGKLNPKDFQALREAATGAALSQRQERDQVLQAKLRSVEEVQWAY